MRLGIEGDLAGVPASALHSKALTHLAKVVSEVVLRTSRLIALGRPRSSELEQDFMGGS